MQIRYRSLAFGTLLALGLVSTAHAWVSAPTPLIGTTAITGKLNAAAASGATYVAVGDGGKVLTSIDNGATWAAATGTNAGHILRDVAFGNGNYVAVGDSGGVAGTNTAAVYYSANGSAWTPATLAAPMNTWSIRDVVWAGTNFIAHATDPATNSSYFLSSPDGINWTQLSGPYTNAAAITASDLEWDGVQLIYANGSGVATSANGIFTGTTVATVACTGCSAVASATIAGVKTYVAGGTGGFFTSLDNGLTWTASAGAIPPAGATTQSIAWDGTQFVAPLSNGSIMTMANATAGWVMGTPNFSGNTLVGAASGSTGKSVIVGNQSVASALGTALLTVLRSDVAPTGGNVAPIASGVASQQAGTQLYTLNGIASSDPDGNIVGYSWVQVSGTPVSLASTGSGYAAFTAPVVGVATTLVFRISVTDNGGATAFQDVTVTLNPTAGGGGNNNGGNNNCKVEREHGNEGGEHEGGEHGGGCGGEGGFALGAIDPLLMLTGLGLFGLRRRIGKQ